MPSSNTNPCPVYWHHCIGPEQQSKSRKERLCFLNNSGDSAEWFLWDLSTALWGRPRKGQGGPQGHSSPPQEGSSQTERLLPWIRAERWQVCLYYLVMGDPSKWLQAHVRQNRWMNICQIEILGKSNHIEVLNGNSLGENDFQLYGNLQSSFWAKE